jgi:hypothetical protein
MVLLSSNRTLKTIRDISTRFHNCEIEKAILKSENTWLIQQVKNLNTIKSQLEKELSRYQHSGINVD